MTFHIFELRRVAFAALVTAALTPAAAAQQRDPPPAAPAQPRPGGSTAPAVPMPTGQAFRPLRPSPPAPEGEQRAVMLQGLDKVTTRTRRFPAAVGATVEFGTLRITVAECLVNVPEAPAETAAHLTIVDHKPGQKPQRMFAGWMFASSPGLSALDSSVYDVWVVACANVSQASTSPISK